MIRMIMQAFYACVAAIDCMKSFLRSTGKLGKVVAKTVVGDVDMISEVQANFAASCSCMIQVVSST